MGYCSEGLMTSARRGTSRSTPPASAIDAWSEEQVALGGVDGGVDDCSDLSLDGAPVLGGSPTKSGVRAFVEFSDCQRAHCDLLRASNAGRGSRVTARPRRQSSSFGVTTAGASDCGGGATESDPGRASRRSLPRAARRVDVNAEDSCVYESLESGEGRSVLPVFEPGDGWLLQPQLLGEVCLGEAETSAVANHLHRDLVRQFQAGFGGGVLGVGAAARVPDGLVVGEF